MAIPAQSGRSRVVESVQRQPDALQPDDEHEHEPAPGQGGQEAGQGPEGEGPDLEQLQVEHGVLHPGLHHEEDGEKHDAGRQRSQDGGIGPPHHVAAVGADTGRDGHHDQDQPDPEGDVAPPVDRRRLADAALLQLEIGPDRPEDAERHGDKEDQPPADGGEQTAHHQAEEPAGDAGDVVDTEGEAPLGRREGVGENGARVGGDKGAADALHHPEADEIGSPGPAVHPVDAQQNGRDGKNEKAQVVEPDPAVHVAQTAEADHQHARHHEVPEHHPEQIEAVAGRQRVEVDAAKDGGHGDQHDRRVDHDQHHAHGGVGQGDPLVAVRFGTDRCARRQAVGRAISGYHPESSPAIFRRGNCLPGKG